MRANTPRPLNDNELILLDKMAKRHNAYVTSIEKLRISYVYQDNFTIAVLRNSKKLWVGSAKRNPNSDAYVQQTGEENALRRAVSALPISLHERKPRVKKVKEEPGMGQTKEEA